MAELAGFGAILQPQQTANPQTTQPDMIGQFIAMQQQQAAQRQRQAQQAGMPVVQAAMAGDPAAQEIVTAASPQDALVLASAGTPPQPAAGPDLNSLLAFNPQALIDEQAAAAPPQTAPKRVPPPGVSSNIPDLIRGDFGAEMFPSRGEEQGTGGLMQNKGRGGDYLQYPERTPSRRQRQQPGQEQPPMETGLQPPTTVEGTLGFEGMPPQAEQVVEQLPVEEEVKGEIKKGVGGIGSAILTSQGDLDTDKLMEMLKKTRDRAVLQAPEDQKEIVWQGMKDPRLWAGVTGLLMALAGGEDIENALLYSAVGASAGQKYLEELNEQEYQGRLQKFQNDIAAGNLSATQQKAEADELRAQAAMIAALKDKSYKQQQWYAQQSKTFQEIFDEERTALATQWAKQADQRTMLNEDFDVPYPTMADVAERANQRIQDMGLATGPIFNVGDTDATGLKGSELVTWRKKYQEAAPEKQQAIMQRLLENGQLDPFQLDYITRPPF